MSFLCLHCFCSLVTNDVHKMLLIEYFGVHSFAILSRFLMEVGMNFPFLFDISFWLCIGKKRMFQPVPLLSCPFRTVG